MQLFSGEKGLWSVVEEALLPRSAFGGEAQRSVGGFRLRRLCLTGNYLRSSPGCGRDG
jgi:hypothetical protein